MKGPGIALLLGGKGKDDEEEEAPESGGGGSVRSLIGQAFDAIKDDDREGYVALMEQAINGAKSDSEED